MMYIRWALMVPVMLIVTILTLPLAFVLPFFVEEREGWHDNNTYQDWGWYLKPWLSWFQTPDNSIDGDQGWREEHWQWRYKLPDPLATYVGRIGWLWRNPGYGFGLITLTNTGVVTEIHNKFGLLVLLGDFFQFRYNRPIGNKVLYCNFGWNIKGLAEDVVGKTQVCTFAFSVRLVNERSL